MDRLVSIIITTYNRREFVRQCVKSLCYQTHRDLEIIVVDDGGSDGTREGLEGFIKGGRIKYFWKENKGLASARNYGLEKSFGDYINFLDDDDFLLPDKISEQLKIFERYKNAELVFSNCFVFDENFNIIGKCLGDDYKLEPIPT